MIGITMKARKLLGTFVKSGSDKGETMVTH
jgi:hypothetical protein